MRPVIIISLLIGLTGCGQADIKQAVQSIAESYDIKQPRSFFVADGKMISINGEVTYILGTDLCTSAFSADFSCWKFSMNAGDVQSVLLANGIRENWVTMDEGRGRVSLVRPNGSRVVGL